MLPPDPMVFHAGVVSGRHHIQVIEGHTGSGPVGAVWFGSTKIRMQVTLLCQ